MLDGQWDAQWIGPAYDPREDIGVFLFRRKFSGPGGTIRVSADNRYKLFLDGRLIGLGPQRGDPAHWFYETYDLNAGPGEHWLTALVWNFGRWSPMAQMSARTGLVVEGTGISTPEGWEVARLTGWDFDMMHRNLGEFYIDVGPGELIRAGAMGGPVPHEGLQWKPAHTICRAEERGTSSGGTPWMLVPRTLPPMRYERWQGSPVVRKGWRGDPGGPERFDLPLTLEPGRAALLDFGELLCAYPRLTLSGDGAELVATYAEALFGPDNRKGNRNEVEGKEVRGYQDKFLPGGEPEVFEPLWWRTFRYLLLENNSQAPATIHALEAVETGYPLEVESSFEADDPWVERIWDVSLRTVERCAGETYFDCPYYEQLQYVGDTRIQALIGYYLGRDRRLQRNAIETLGWSIMEGGLTQSRYPSRQIQIIPPFSIIWRMMASDWRLYADVGLQDRSSPESELRSALAWAVQDSVTEDAMRAGQSFWQFMDWVPEWPWGVPRSGVDSGAIVALHMLASTLSFRDHADSSAGRNEPQIGSQRGPGHTVRNGLTQFLIDPEGPPTEHLEALVRCRQVALGREPDPWPTEALAKANAAKCTYYFSYYKHLAMFGRQDAPFDYLTELQPWKEMIEDGLTTFAENPEPARSDCHAWSAHPILGFFQIVAGVTSAAAGWQKAAIMPHPGSLRRFKASIAHPAGNLMVAFEDGRLEIDSPVPFELRWKGKVEDLPAGRHRS